jgi:hypothetical protein
MLVGIGSYQALLLPSPGPGLLVLSQGEAELVQSLGEALFPPGNPLQISAVEVDLVGAVDQLLGTSLDPMVGEVFRNVLRTLDFGTTTLRGTSFVSLPLKTRQEIIAIWADESVIPRRMALDSVRLVLGMAFLGDPTVQARLGWESSCSWSNS